MDKRSRLAGAKGAAVKPRRQGLAVEFAPGGRRLPDTTKRASTAKVAAAPDSAGRIGTVAGKVAASPPFAGGFTSTTWEALLVPKLGDFVE